MKETMKRTMVMGTYRHYRKQADGSLMLVGDVTYERPAGTNEPGGLDAPGYGAYLAARNAADCARQDEMCAWFEALADQACTMEA